MKVNIRRIDSSLPLPRHETNGAVGFDLVTREDTVIQPREIKLISGNVIVQVPRGYALLIIPRSSTARKKGLICPHSLGVIDQDYCGPDDEVMVQVQNITNTPVIVTRGERIAQGLFVKVETAEWVEVKESIQQTRGGFGSTDNR
ncbi:dUTP diphosphatase [Candidatus Peregrinibacteria bacterium]|nr:dUTP diphosphatase [Candidatus Peregrinibacteria bacterium]